MSNKLGNGHSCADCRFFAMARIEDEEMFDLPQDEGRMGWCRRYPRASEKLAKYWCGEHEER